MARKPLRKRSIRYAIICSVRTINLFCTHQIRCHKWSILLMCRDPISEGFFHTPATMHSPPPRAASEYCSGQFGDGAELAALYGAGPSLERRQRVDRAGLISRREKELTASLFCINDVGD